MTRQWAYRSITHLPLQKIRTRVKFCQTKSPVHLIFVNLTVFSNYTSSGLHFMTKKILYKCCLNIKIVPGIFKATVSSRRRDFRFPMSALAMAARKGFFFLNGKFTAKIDFPIGHFMLPLLTLTLEVYSKVFPYII